MKTIIIILTGLMMIIHIGNNDRSSERLILKTYESSKERIEKLITINPEIIGPTEVQLSSSVKWEASPDVNNCSQCTYTWYMTDTMPFNYSTDVVGGPDSSDFLDWIVGVEPSSNDFYFQLKITDTSTSSDYWSDAILIKVN